MFSFRSLASGSSGNAFLLKSGKSTLLFDAGVTIQRLRQLLAAEDTLPEQVSALFISHEHRDHCAAARDLAVMHATPIHANIDVLKACGVRDFPRSAVLEVGRSTVFGDVQVTTFAVSHDAVRPVGFFIEVAGRSIVLATDLGVATDAVTERVSRADLIVLESNHDSEMLHQGRYPIHLRQRVAGPRGHLSNAQAGSILARFVGERDVDVWLAHLSKENNTPAHALKTVRRTLKSVGLDGLGVDVAVRDRPSLRWTGVARPRQLSLFSAAAGG